MSIRIGLIGIVDEESKRDFWGTMKKVAALGYRGIESPTYLLEGNAAQNVSRFRRLGLEAIALGATREDLRAQPDEVISTARALRTRHVVVYWGPCESKEQLLADARLYDQAGALLREAGLRLCYHNHEHEFQTRFNNLYALDILAEHTDPRNLAFEIDIAWVTYGGEDPARVLRRYAGRAPLIHVKDFWSLEKRDRFTALGTGVVKAREGVQAAIEAGAEWLVVEQDLLRNLDAMETATLSYLTLKEQFASQIDFLD